MTIEHAHTQPSNPSARAGLDADIRLLGGAVGDRRARVAITSYEFNGIVRNGGIGTACSSLAKALAEDGHEVDLVFTGWAEDPGDESFERWRRHYAGLGVRLDRPDVEALSHGDAALYNTVHSLALYRLLKERDDARPYDAIHFVESLGHGMYSLAAKRQGLAFRDATTVVGVHSPRRWIAEAHGAPFDHPVEIGDDFLERRSIELADVVVSPSAHMLDWLERRGVRLPERSYVQQYVTAFDREASTSNGTRDRASGPRDAGTAPIEEIVYFGRIEPRKGLLSFCDALDELARDRPANLRRVTLLGKQVPFAEGGTSGDYVRDRAREWPWAVELVDRLDRDEALDYVRQPGRLAVMASPIDNSPNTVYEALGLGVAFVASRGGGIGELIHPDDRERVTYDPRDAREREIDPGDPASSRPAHSGRTLAARLRRALGAQPRPARFAVDPASNRATHLAWHRAAAAGATPAAGDPPQPPALEPLDIRDLAAAASGTGSWLLLRDPDAEVDAALAATLTAAAGPGIGFVTALGSFDVETPDGPVQRIFLPAGGPPASGLLGNCAGAGVVLARREALDRIGAFGDAHLADDVAVADLLAEAALAGERIDVVPAVLYHLPSTAVPGGAITRARGTFQTLRPYYRALGPDGSDIAAVARRSLEQEPGLRARAERAERELAATARRLDVIVNSRSWRSTGPLRRAAARLRRRGGDSGA